MLGHKNDFGRLLALASNIFLVAFMTRHKWRWAYLLGSLSAVFLIGGSRSGQAVVLLVLPPIALVMLLWLRKMSLQIRSLVLIVSLPIGLFLFLISNVIMTEVLNLLGKDPTLTGRSDIWNAVLSSLGHHVLLGGGYGTGWDLVAEGVLMRIGGTMTHAHNGYLDLLLDVGIVGLSITLTFYALILLKMNRYLLSVRRTEIVSLTLVVMLFSISGNWVASFLLDYNRIYLNLPAVLYAKLTQQESAEARNLVSLTPSMSHGLAH
jgi:O-antigen ligase